MPDVGVLNLEIHDNSQTAGDGLRHLGDALRYVKEQTEGFKLTGVSGPLNKFASAISGNAKVLSNVGSFLNAMKEYQKVFKDAENVKFNAAPIEAIKNALGDGIKIGQAGTQLNKIREALGGDWNTANSGSIKTVMEDIATGSKAISGANLGSTANNVSKAAKALMEYADASRQIKSALGESKGGASLDAMDSVKSRLPLNLQLHGGKSDFSTYKSEIKGITSAYKEFAEESKDLRFNGLGNMDFVAKPLQALPGMYNDMAQNLEIYKSGLFATLPKIQQMSSEEMVVAGNAKIMTKAIDDLMSRLDKPQNFKNLRDIVDINTGVARQNTSLASDSAKVFESLSKESEAIHNVSESMSELKEATQTTQAFTQSVGNAIETSIRFHAEAKAKYSERLPETFEDIFYGTREKAMGKTPLMSNWLHGQGTETEQVYAIQQMARQFNMSVDEVKAKIAELNGVQLPSENGVAEKLEQYLGTDKVELMSQRLDMMKQSAVEAYSAGQMTEQQFLEQAMRIQDYSDKLADAREEQDNLANSAFSLSGAFGALRTGLKQMFPTLSGLLGRFKQIVKYRMIRSVIKHITSGFSEGIQNVYQYSKAIGSSFAPSMDSAATAIQQMKNSLGAALAPAIQALIPILNTVVNWFINLVNYANQFFALLNGQKTWTRALPATTEAFNKQKKAAKGASAAVKDLLADWDELNIIQSQTGGSGSGAGTTTAEDYLKMFEEVGRFDNKIKDITDFVKRNFSDILVDVGLIGAGMKLWKLSRSVEEALPFLSKLAGWATVGATIAVTLQLTDMLGQEYAATGDPGWLIADGLTGAVGATIAGEIAAKLAGGAAGYAMSGFTLVLAGLVNVKNALSAAQQENIGRAWALGALGSVEMGIGVGLGLAALGAGTGVAIAGGVITAGIVMLLTASVILDKKPKAIRWGNYKATAEEIKAYVEDTVFVVSPNTILNVVDPVVEVKNEKQEELTASVAEVKLSVQKLMLGIDVDNTLNELKEQVFGNSENGTVGIIGKFKETAMAMNNVIETGITIVPVSGINEDGSPKEIIDKSGEGWRLLTGHMDDLGNDLAYHLAESYKTSLDEKAREMELRSVTEITEMITSVSSAITRGQERESLIRGLEENLMNLTPESWGNLFTYINQYKDEIKKAYTNAYDEVTDALAGEQNGLKQAMENELKRSGNVETDKYKQYKAEYEYITGLLDSRRKGRKQAIDDATNGAMDESVVERIREALLTNVNYDAIGAENIFEAFSNIGINLNSSGVLEQFLDGFFNDNGTVTEYAKNKYDIFIDGLLQSVYKDSYGYVKAAIDAGIVSYEDLLPKETINALVQGFLLNKDNTEVQEALAQFIGGQFEIGNGTNNEAIEQAKSTAEAIKEEYYGALNRGIAENSAEMDKLLGELYGKYGDEVEKVLELNTVIKAEPEFIVDSIEIEDELREAIQKALEDKVITVDERNALDFMFGAGTVDDAIQKLYEQGMNPDGTFGKLPSGAKLTASAGMTSGVRWNTSADYGVNGSGGESIKTEPKDPQQEVSNTAAGVKQGNAEVVSELHTLVQRMEQLLAKNWTVNVSPTTGLARTTAAAGVLLGKVTGEI